MAKFIATAIVVIFLAGACSFFALKVIDGDVGFERWSYFTACIGFAWMLIAGANE